MCLLLVICSFYCTIADEKSFEKILSKYVDLYRYFN